MKIKMLVSSTNAAKGRVVERDEREAKRLIEAGFAIPYEEDDASVNERLAVIEERLAVIETAVSRIPENSVNVTQETQDTKPRRTQLIRDLQKRGLNS